MWTPMSMSRNFSRYSPALRTWMLLNMKNVLGGPAAVVRGGV
jgi:hypothetical protein